MSKNLLIKKLNDDAVIPTRAYNTDSGYDITLTHFVKENEHGVKFYGTGISLQPPEGYYTELFPRSSIAKTGYMLANSIGVLDFSYRGEIFVPLIKVNKSSPDIVLPIRLCQLVIKKRYDLIIEEVKEFSSTERGDGCFGSTGN